MNRREFIARAAAAAAAAYLPSSCHRAATAPALTRKYSASDTVVLGNTGIKTSRLAMGTGSLTVKRVSHQSRLGVQGLSNLLRNGYDNGLLFIDAADMYGSHPGVAETLKHVPRDKVTVLTKSLARDAKTARADLDRFRRELGTDYLDILLIHFVTEGDWTERYREVMDVYSEAKQKGIIRAHGCSCHSIKALRAAARSPWVDVDMVRINPIGSHMDNDPETVVSVIREMKNAGKAVVGMKILGEGDMRHRQDEALRYALGIDLLDSFTIGAESKAEQQDLVRRIASL